MFRLALLASQSNPKVSGVGRAYDEIFRNTVTLDNHMRNAELPDVFFHLAVETGPESVLTITNRFSISLMLKVCSMLLAP